MSIKALLYTDVTHTLFIYVPKMSLNFIFFDFFYNLPSSFGANNGSNASSTLTREL